jgi:tRNA1(Val) A37 N6-methylase TrmN6
MIQRADALPALLPALERRLGDVALRPVHPRADAPAIRLLISGTKGSKAPLRLLPGLTLHEPDGATTPLAAAIQRGEATL